MPDDCTISHEIIVFLQQLTTENKAKDDCIYRHFNQPDHQGLADVRVWLINKCWNVAILRDGEAQWAYQL